MRRFWIALAIVVLIFAAGCAWFAMEHRRALAHLDEQFTHEQQALLNGKASFIEQDFKFLSVGLKNIALLPGIRSITGTNLPKDFPTKYDETRFTRETRETVQQFYNNLASLISISEVYFILDGFKPKDGETPFFMFDELIVGDSSSGETAESHEEHHNADEPEESEDEEYAAYTDHLARLKADHARFTFKSFDEIPFLLSRPVRTCDNSQYLSVKDGNLRDASGFAASVPVYDTSGAFTGLVTAVVRSNVIEAAILGVPFLPITPADQEAAKTAGFSLPNDPVLFRVISKDLGYTWYDRRAESLLKDPTALESTHRVYRQRLSVPTPESWGIEFYANTQELKDGARAQLVQTIGKIALLGLIGGIILLGLWSGIQKRRQIEEISEHMNDLADGRLRDNIEMRGREEVQRLAEIYTRVVTNLRRKMDFAQWVADGDLTIDPAVPKASRDDSLGNSLAQMVENLRALVGTIRRNAEDVDRGAGEISTGSHALSSETMNAAAATEQISSSVAEISNRFTQSLERQQEASKEATAASETADRAAPEISAITAAMRAAQSSGVKITSVVKLIDDIAFQTNLLALNAAVEAARAGTHGKGFAVVADEVRALAGRSATAAKQVSEMIDEVQRVITQGASRSDAVDTHLKEITSQVRRVAELLTHVTNASGTEQSALAEVSIAMRKIGDGTQKNSALAEELSAAAAELRSQATQMREATSTFRV